MRTFAILFVAALTFGWAPPGGAQPVQSTATVRKTVLDGAYTTAQAMRGRDGFAAHCASCHGADLSGVSAPALKGEKFLERWRDDSLDTLFAYIRSAMPRGIPAGSPRLGDNVYLDLYTYILEQNSYPAGTEELNAAQLESIQLVGKDGPKPPPDGAVVLVVGCFVENEKGEWGLVNATEPVRTRKPNETNPKELNASATTPLGNRTFLVRDIEAVPDFIPDFHKGERMQAKGFLVRQPNAERINLISMESVGPACTP